MPILSAHSSSSVSASTTTAGDTAATSSTQMLFCAVPRDRRALDINSMPDAYQKKSLFTSDDFFEIGVNDGGVKAVPSDPAKNLDATNLKIFGQSLFSINRFDKKLYSLPLISN